LYHNGNADQVKKLGARKQSRHRALPCLVTHHDLSS
jgi:hypothetical protein